MHLDSHRRQNSSAITSHTEPSSIATTAPPKSSRTAVTMACPRSRCSQPLTFTADDGTEMQTWFSIRREHIRNMRRMVKRVIFYMALIEAIRIGPDTIVFAGTRGYPEKSCHDFGIAYYAGYILSYVYLCIFTIVWKPLFSWWVSPSAPSTDEPQTVEKVTSVLQQINMVLLPVSIAIHLLEYIFWLGMTFIYVDARPVDSNKMPKSTHKNWLARLMLLVGIFVTTTFGHCVFEILAETGLAHVKLLEYLIIVVPIQINLGILLGSAMQWRMEKRLEKKAMAAKALELGTVDEKEALLVV